MAPMMTIAQVLITRSGPRLSKTRSKINMAEARVENVNLQSVVYWMYRSSECCPEPPRVKLCPPRGALQLVSVSSSSGALVISGGLEAP